MAFYAGFVYPAIMIALAAMLVAGLLALVWVRVHVVLKWVVTAVYIATALQLITIVALLVAGLDVPLLTTIGYVVVSVALLPLLGIGRLGEPAAAATDPNRPVLAPDQVARVDAMAAIIVGLALAVVAWRIEVIVAAGA